MRLCNRILLSVALVLDLALVPVVAFACFRAEETIQQTFEGADVVLAGSVARVEPRYGWIVRSWSLNAPPALGGDPRRADEAVAIVRVDRAFKGVARHAEVKVATYTGRGWTCFPWERLSSGERVLLFAHRLESGELRVIMGYAPFKSTRASASILKDLHSLAPASGG